MKKIFLFLFFPCLTFAQKWQISAPAGNEQTKIDKTGKSVIPNGRFLTPRGRQIMTAPHPYGLILTSVSQIEEKEDKK